MRRTLIALLITLASAAPAWALCPTQRGLEEWNRIADSKVPLMQALELRDCIIELRGAIESKRAEIDRLGAALDTAWKAFSDAGTLIEAMPPLSQTLYEPANTVGLIEGLYSSLGTVTGMQSADIVEALDRRFARPGALRGFYDTFKPVIARWIDTRATPHVVAGHIRANRVLFEKSFDPFLGSQAFAWFHERCVTSEEAEAAHVHPAAGITPPEQCKTKDFVGRFEKYYGVKPTLGLARALTSLNLRFLHGGPGYVKEIQSVALDLLRTLDPSVKAAAKK